MHPHQFHLGMVGCMKLFTKALLLKVVAKLLKCRFEVNVPCSFLTWRINNPLYTRYMHAAGKPRTAETDCS